MSKFGPAFTQRKITEATNAFKENNPISITLANKSKNLALNITLAEHYIFMTR